MGTAFAFKELNDRIIPQQALSLAVALGAVLILTALTQGSIWLGLAALCPILVTLVGLFGTMGYAGIHLSVITGIMSGLTVGVGIDYAIHYVSAFRSARARGDSDPAGSAMRYVGTPVLANALGLAIGFTAMVFSRVAATLTLISPSQSGCTCSYPCVAADNTSEALCTP